MKRLSTLVLMLVLPALLFAEKATPKELDTVPGILIGTWKIGPFLASAPATDVSQSDEDRLTRQTITFSVYDRNASAFFGTLRVGNQAAQRIAGISSRILSDEDLDVEFRVTRNDLKIGPADVMQLVTLSLDGKPTWRNVGDYPGDSLLIINSKRVIMMWDVYLAMTKPHR